MSSLHPAVKGLEDKGRFAASGARRGDLEGFWCTGVLVVDCYLMAGRIGP